MRIRPPAVRPEEVRRALGRPAAREALRGLVLRALPTVAALEGELERLARSERDELLARADEVLAHRFDLLGSGPTDLGTPIDWHRDFKSGRRWPLDHVSRIRLVYGDGSDIKVPWELSRCQHLPLLAAAGRMTGDPRYARELGTQLDDWIRRNPVERGPNWACTMDVAIRAANWVAALALVADREPPEPWLDRAVASLLLHGRFIRSHLETGRVRGNHYLADVVGLLPLAALFADGAEGRAWAEWGAHELVVEMAHQVRPDGCAHEASTSYHRLVCELFVCGTHAVDALLPGAIPEWYRTRLERMLDFVADYTRPDGCAPLIGDADDGRFLPLADYGRDPRSHLHLFAQAGRPYVRAGGHAAYPDGGFYVMRAGDLYAIVRCGDTGVGGLGWHAHNDQLSFELVAGDEALVVDPGSYLYTADPEARDLFRSTGFHATLRVGGGEQNELRRDRPFELRDRARAEALDWRTGTERARFEGRHRGYLSLDPPATHTRALELCGPDATLSIIDTVESRGAPELEWTFPLAPCVARGGRGSATARFEASTLEIVSPELEFRVEEGWCSPRYGVRVRAPFVRARRTGRPGSDVTELVLRVTRA